MPRPKLLDLFCKAGGCSVGYYRAGFDVVGVDIEPQPHYPFTFIQADALTYPLSGFDVVHASPPCQSYSITKVMTAWQGKKPRKPYQDLLPPVRERLQAWGGVWVIENVPGAPVQHGIVLCGSMFGLQTMRHRHFEASHYLYEPGPCRHDKGSYNVQGGRVRGYGVYASSTTYRCKDGSIRAREGSYQKAVGQKALGIDWMTIEEMSEAIPPAYTEYVGMQLMNILEGATYATPT